MWRPEKPRTPPREIAKKAVSEITKTPPHLFVYSIAGAAAVILLVIGGIWYHIHSGEADDDSTPAAANEVATQTVVPANASPVTAAAAPSPAQVVPEAPAEAAPAVSITPKFSPKSNKKKVKSSPVAPAIVEGWLSVDSTPQGAQIQMDGQAAGVTPFNLAELKPGQHLVTVSKPGFVTDTRTVEVSSGSKSVMSVQLAELSASVSLHSDPCRGSGVDGWQGYGQSDAGADFGGQAGQSHFCFQEAGVSGRKRQRQPASGADVPVGTELAGAGQHGRDQVWGEVQEGVWRVGTRREWER